MKGVGDTKTQSPRQTQIFTVLRIISREIKYMFVECQHTTKLPLNEEE